MQIVDIDTNPQRPKEGIVADVQGIIAELGYEIVDENTQKPWGAYFRFAEENAPDFIENFFADYDFPLWVRNHELNPKFLLVAPGKRLSWQYHQERGEVWKVLKGPIESYLAGDDRLPEPEVLVQDEIIEAKPNTRHRIGGLEAWAIVAEIWVHANEGHPSTEADIVRLEDDFGRS